MRVSPAKIPAPNTVTAHAPGRINLIGEHTDYNEGFVLPAAIGQKLTVRLRSNGTANVANVTDLQGQQIRTFRLDDLQPTGTGWHNYVAGIVYELQHLGAKITGFDAEFAGDVPIGSGMSSSAALECSFAIGLNKLFGLGLEKWQLIKAAQLAEHHFVGTKCGIMDQFASVMGRKNHVMLLDCRSLDYQYFPFVAGHFQVWLLNTNVSHSLASSEYNVRRAECEAGVAILQKKHPGINSLRDVTPEQIAAGMARMPEPVFRRCRHVVTENQRVLAATQALQHDDFATLGELMYQSHYSLQNDYEVSCPELDFLVRETMALDYVAGSRMMGGGFGGCTINLVEKSRVPDFLGRLSENYRRRFGIDLTPVEVSIEDGATANIEPLK